MTTTNINPPATATRAPLRAVLAVNAATSAAVGLLASVAPGTVSDLLGLAHDRADLIVRAIGIGLTIFAVGVASTAARHREATIARDTALISAADIAWVASTVVVLATVDLSFAGRVIAAVMAAAVAAFAAMQLRFGQWSPHRSDNPPENRR